MLDAALMHDDVIDRLRCLVQPCHEAAVSGHDLAEPYMAVRADAAALNQQYGWATSEEFAAHAACSPLAPACPACGRRW